MTTVTKVPAKGKANTVTPFKLEAGKLVSGEAALKKLFASIHNRGQSLQKDVHIAACSTLRHVAEHKDVRMVSALMLALPESYRTNALRDWFAEFGPVVWEQNKPVFKRDAKTRLAEGMATPFWKFSPEAPYVPVDVMKLIETTIKKLTADQEKTGRHHGTVIAALEAAKPATVAVN